MSRLPTFEEHPKVHIARNAAIKKLTSYLHDRCVSEGMRGEPPSAVTRWLFVQKLVDKGTDAFIPSTTNVFLILVTIQSDNRLMLVYVMNWRMKCPQKRLYLSVKI